ncbi:MAG: GNAT family N-acetyltransferase [Planctomycetes bacterium]|nr:GNAT family N-acetyltransferase [Planctomycetota bacterium]
MIIRPATPADVPQIVRLFYETVHAVCAADYTPAQLDAWAPAVPGQRAWAGRLATRTTFVADDGGTIAGFAELQRDGHIDCFYTHKSYQRLGVGSALLERLERHARAAGLGRLTADVSLTARAFFEHRGFRVVRPQSVVRGGVRLDNLRMELILPAGAH